MAIAFVWYPSCTVHASQGASQTKSSCTVSIKQKNGLKDKS